MPAPAASVVAVLGVGLVDPATPLIPFDDPGLTRGDGCFEGCLLRDGTVVQLEDHLARMARSAAALEITFDADAWRALVGLAASAWPDAGEATVKVVLTRGSPGTGSTAGTAADTPAGFVAITPMSPDSLRQRRTGVRAVTLNRGFAATAFTAAPWLLGGVKTLSYAVNMAALREVQRRGADDAVFVSSDGYVLESPTSSIVWAMGRTLATTPTGVTGILAGTTQRLLFGNAVAAGWQVRDVLATVDDLHAADAVWLLSSVRGPVEVLDLDGTSRAAQPALHAEIVALAGF